MESKALDAIQEQLQKERSLIHGKAEKIRLELASLDQDMARIDAALAALSGAELTRTLPKTAKAKERKPLQAPAPKKADVAKHIRRILNEQGVVEEVALKSQVEAEVMKAGFSRMGFAMRFKEALADEQFIDTPGGIRLKEEKLLVAKS